MSVVCCENVHCRLAKKKKKGGGGQDSKDGKKSQGKDGKSMERMGTMKSQDGKHDDDHKEKSKAGDRPESHMTVRGDRADSSMDEKYE